MMALGFALDLGSAGLGIFAAAGVGGARGAILGVAVLFLVKIAGGFAVALLIDPGEP